MNVEHPPFPAGHSQCANSTSRVSTEIATVIHLFCFFKLAAKTAFKQNFLSFHYINRIKVYHLLTEIDFLSEIFFDNCKVFRHAMMIFFFTKDPMCVTASFGNPSSELTHPSVDADTPSFSFKTFGTSFKSATVFRRFSPRRISLVFHFNSGLDQL